MKKYSFIFILFHLILVACNPLAKTEEDNTGMIGALAVLATGNAVTSIPFTLVAGTDTSFGCNKLTTGHSTSERHISESMNFYLKDARLYVHDVKMVNADNSTVDFTLSNDGVWQNGTVALLDFENQTGDCSTGTMETNTTLKGYAAPGNYIGIQFKIGVPSAQNNLNATTASAPLNNSAMYWSWTSGFKFLKFEWKTTEGAGGTGTFHLGAGTCTGSGATSNLSCALPNIPTVTIKTANSTVWIPNSNPVYLDAKTLVSGTNTNVSSGGANLTCMSGNATASCKPLLNNVGVNETDGKTLSTQSAFYLKP
jgi:uncharacterized repeat protein (TIGR04052 family)